MESEMARQALLLGPINGFDRPAGICGAGSKHHLAELRRWCSIRKLRWRCTGATGEAVVEPLGR